MGNILKVEVEAIFEKELESVLSTMMNAAMNAKSLNECMRMYNTMSSVNFIPTVLDFGRGGSHVWVSQKKNDKQRVLLITKRKW